MSFLVMVTYLFYTFDKVYHVNVYMQSISSQNSVRINNNFQTLGKTTYPYNVVFKLLHRVKNTEQALSSF